MPSKALAIASIRVALTRSHSRRAKPRNSSGVRSSRIGSPLAPIRSSQFRSDPNRIKAARGRQNHVRVNGTAGRYYSKNQKAAKDFLRWVNSKEIFGQWFTSQQGYSDGATKYWEEDPVWNVDPVL